MLYTRLCYNTLNRVIILFLAFPVQPKDLKMDFYDTLKKLDNNKHKK